MTNDTRSASAPALPSPSSKRTKVVTLREADSVSLLPFVRDVAPKGVDKGRDFWTVDETGDYVRDINLGRIMAREAMAYMVRNNRGGGILGWIAEAMIAKGRFGGVEVGFFDIIEASAIRSAAVQP